MSKQPAPRFVSIPGIASILNVGESRVRQLVMSTDFPKPMLSLSPRTRVWSADVIREWGRSAQDSTRVTATSLPIVNSALPRIIDELVTAKIDEHPGHLTVYLRAFQGDGYTIAIVSAPEKTYGMQAHREGIYSSILTQFDSILGARVCWIEDLRSVGPGEIANPVVTVLPDRTVTDPAWLPFTYEELTERLGARLEMYPKERMTESFIRLYQTMRTTVLHDRNDDQIQSLMETLRLLENASSLPEESRTHALDLTAHALLSVDQFARSSSNDPMDAYTYPARVKWAVRDQIRPLRENELELADRYAIRSGPSWAEMGELNEVTVRHLAAWKASVDKYSESPDERVYRRLDGLIRTMTMHIRDRHVRELAEETNSYTDEQRVILFLSTRPHVERYLQESTPEPTPRELWRREHRVLASQVGADAEFKRDQFGNLIALNPTSRILGVLWPKESNTTAADTVMLDGTLDTIVYLVDADRQKFGLLPRIKRPQSVGWASGYGGTGAGDLIAAIVSYADAIGHPVSSESIRRVISNPEIAETTSISL